MILVELEFSRIQTFLFASPRLKAMLGANSLLAKVIRIDLTELAKDCGAKRDPAVDDETLPSESSEDPLSLALCLLETDPDKASLRKDDPQALYRDMGVLIRDGGHFKATFSDEFHAKDFARKALDHVAAELPGLRAECRVGGEILSDTTSSAILPYGHAGWQICQMMGDRPASGYNQDKKLWVSKDEQDLEEQGSRFRDDLNDIISILESSDIIRKWADTSVSDTKQDIPKDLGDIATQGYLALIHADGNSIGQRFNAWKDQGPKEKGVMQEVRAERFFHGMRVAVRHSLCKALAEVFGRLEDTRQRYQLLMLGGDDLLLACSAEYAFPFIVAYAKALSERPLIDGKPLTIGAGIAIAKDSFPFHRLHEAAEALADSAKRLYRSRPELGSVVDWHITSQSWVDDPLDERRALYGDAPLLASARPYAILSERSQLFSFEALLEFAKDAHIEPLARSQLRAFLEILHQGDPVQADLAWREMPKELLSGLSRLSKREKDIAAWKTCEEAGRVISVVGDFIDLYELPRLGRLPREST
jgi:hypothetical protein